MTCRSLLAELADAGCGVRRSAKLLGLSPSYVSMLRSRFGIITRDPIISPLLVSQCNEFRRLHKRSRTA